MEAGSSLTYISYSHIQTDYRRQGISQQLISWGLEHADRLCLDIFPDSTPPGRPLYEANDFTYVQESVIHLRADEKDKSSGALETSMGGFTFCPLMKDYGSH